MHRFWPVKERQILSLDEGSAIVAKLVSGTYAGAAARFKLVHSVTAGWDSRMLLACARNHVHNMQFYFYRGYKHNVDYEIAKQISDKFGLKARFVDLNDLKVDKDFEKIYYSNNILARPKLLKGYYDSYVNNLEGTVTISGTMGNEIVRIMSSLKRNTGNAHDIAKLLGYANYPYVIDSLNDWLKDSVYLKNKNHILIDLFCWEQFFANWGPLSGSEQDIVREELRPFNNRAVLSAILSLQDKNRYRDYPMIYVRTIKNLWPELLQFEVDIKRNSFKKVLRTIGIERVTDVVFHSVRNYRTSIKDYIKKAKILNNPLKPALSSNHL
jgi:hypothetical protein